MPQFSSYATDPTYASAFIITWASVAALCVLVALPRFVRSARQGQLWVGLRGVGEDFGYKAYQPVVNDVDEKKMLYGGTPRPFHPVNAPGWRERATGWATALGTLTLYSPLCVGLDLGQSECLFARGEAARNNEHHITYSLRDTRLSSHSNSLYPPSISTSREWK
jgi:hypothetical protein